jgi:hypothetical protein
MTGRVASVRDDRVTIDGVTYDFPEHVRWVLEQSALDGCEVDFAVIGGTITKACRMHWPVRP